MVPAVAALVFLLLELLPAPSTTLASPPALTGTTGWPVLVASKWTSSSIPDVFQSALASGVLAASANSTSFGLQRQT